MPDGPTAADLTPDQGGSLTPPTHIRSLRLGGAYRDRAHGLATDAAGNLYLTGEFQGSLQLGATALASSGGSLDGFVISYTPAATLRWSQAFGGTGADMGEAIAVVSGAALLVGGRFTGSLTLGSAVTSKGAGSDLLLARLATADGTPAWAQAVGADAALNETLCCLQPDRTGGGVAGGNLADTTTLGGEDVTVQGPLDGFVHRVSATGLAGWHKLFSGPTYDHVRGLWVAGDGTTYVVGDYTAPSLTVDGNVYGASSGVDLFAARLPAGGGPATWVKVFGGTSNDWAYDVVGDGSGSIYLTGSFSDSVTFGSKTLSSPGAAQAYVLKLSAATGDVVWVRGLPASDSSSGQDLAWSSHGPVVAGRFRGTMTVAGQSLTAAGAQDLFIVGLAGDGSPRWAAQFGGNGTAEIGDMVVDDSGRLYLTGWFTDAAAYSPGGSSLTAVGHDDIFLLQLQL